MAKKTHQSVLCSVFRDQTMVLYLVSCRAPVVFIAGPLNSDIQDRFAKAEDENATFKEIARVNLTVEEEEEFEIVQMEVDNEEPGSEVEKKRR